MIVGSGLLARALAPYFAADPTTVVFASGVSNSTETDATAFEREHGLLQQHIDNRPSRLLYFGSCNVTNPDQDSPYFNHKRRMEGLVRDAMGGLVIRLPQVVGTTGNPNTLTNHLRNHIDNGIPLKIWTRAQRNLIDVEDVAAICHHLVNNGSALPSVISVASPWTLPMREIVRIFEKVLHRRATLVEIDRGEGMVIDSALAEATAIQLGIDFGPDYPLRTIAKYYGHS